MGAIDRTGDPGVTNSWSIGYKDAKAVINTQ